MQVSESIGSLQVPDGHPTSSCSNAADLGTKHLDRSTMKRHLEFMGYYSLQHGRSISGGS
eukprot:4609124-Amphidinium_carterae.1